MNKKALDLAVAIIKQREGCRLTAYLCPAGIPTIGYGETKGVKLGMKWTQLQADTAILSRVGEFMAGVVAACPSLASEAPYRLAACTSLAYNIGLKAFASSTVCRKTAAKDYKGAADAFLLWNKANGKVLPGLVSRRQAERQLYLEGKLT